MSWWGYRHVDWAKSRKCGKSHECGRSQEVQKRCLIGQWPPRVKCRLRTNFQSAWASWSSPFEKRGGWSSPFGKRGVQP